MNVFCKIEFSLWRGGLFNALVFYKRVQNGVAYVRVFVGILRDISKQETVEYILAMVDEMLTGLLLEKRICGFMFFWGIELRLTS